MKHDSVVIMSIHQPRYSIFKLFDRLTLLSQGHMVYHGDASFALHHFSNLGRSIFIETNCPIRRCNSTENCGIRD